MRALRKDASVNAFCAQICIRKADPRKHASPHFTVLHGEGERERPIKTGRLIQLVTNRLTLIELRRSNHFARSLLPEAEKKERIQSAAGRVSLLGHVSFALNEPASHRSISTGFVERAI